MGYAKNWLTKEEWKRLKKAPTKKKERGDYKYKEDLKKWRDELLLRTMYYGGLRVSEALDLQYPYNFSTSDGNGYIVLYGKKQKDGEEDKQKQPAKHDLVRDVGNFMTAFHDEKETNFVFEIHRSTAYSIVKDMGEYADIDKKISNHTLRRSRALHLIESGQMDLSQVSRFLRHNRVETTMEYLDFATKDLADIVNKIDQEHDL